MRKDSMTRNETTVGTIGTVGTPTPLAAIMARFATRPIPMAVPVPTVPPNPEVDDPQPIPLPFLANDLAPAPARDWFARFNTEPADWTGDAVRLIDWFETHRDTLPRTPFRLFPFAAVSNPPTFYIALERDIRAGPNGPRAVGLQHELQRLRELF